MKKPEKKKKYIEGILLPVTDHDENYLMLLPSVCTFILILLFLGQVKRFIIGCCVVSLHTRHEVSFVRGVNVVSRRVNVCCLR